MLLASPAKINLFFRVLKKRADGYHETASLMQAIDLCDSILIEKGDVDSVTFSCPKLTRDPSNLVARALYLFRSAFPFSFKVRIHVEKKIPMQAGLGGGSSNAATVLWGLNELQGRPATVEQLIALGTQLGSDVPFFFSSGTAYCTGRGEKIEPFCLPYPMQGCVAKPPFGLSTQLVYQKMCLEDLMDRDPLQSLERYPDFYNDLEHAAFELEPRLISFRAQLKAMGFASVTMTGSGTAFFCLGNQNGSMHNIDQAQGQSLFVAFRTIQRHNECWFIYRT